MSSLVDSTLRPLRVFLPVFVLASPVFTVAAAYTAVTLPPLKDRVVAVGSRGTSIELPEMSQVTVYAASGTPAPASDACALTTPDGRTRAIDDLAFSGTISAEGQQWYPFGETDVAAPRGSTVECTAAGPQRVLVADNPSKTPLLVPVLCAVTALGSAVMALAGLAARRAHRQRVASH